MSRSVEDHFIQAAQPARKVEPKRKRSPTVAMRVSEEEKAALEKAAGNVSLNAYLRERIFDDGRLSLQKPARSRRKKPVQDGAALGQVLAALGRSGIPDALERLLAAQQRKSSFLASGRAQSVDLALLQACADIAVMKAALIRALGLQADSGAECHGRSP